jgi:hypothetical protein
MSARRDSLRRVVHVLFRRHSDLWAVALLHILGIRLLPLFLFCARVVVGGQEVVWVFELKTIYDFPGPAPVKWSLSPFCDVDSGCSQVDEVGIWTVQNEHVPTAKHELVARDPPRVCCCGNSVLYQ